MPEKYSLVLEIFWIQEETALDGPVQAIRAAPAPPPSSAFSAAPAAPWRLWWQQESALASSGFIMGKAAGGVIHQRLYAPWRNKADYTLLLCSAVISKRGRELLDFILMYRYSIQK